MKNNPRLEDFLISLDIQFDSFIIESNFLDFQKYYISILNAEDLKLFYSKNFFPEMNKKFSLYLKHKGFFNKDTLCKKGYYPNNKLLEDKNYENEINQEYLFF